MLKSNIKPIFLYSRLLANSFESSKEFIKIKSSGELQIFFNFSRLNYCLYCYSDWLVIHNNLLNYLNSQGVMKLLKLMTVDLKGFIGFWYGSNIYLSSSLLKFLTYYKVNYINFYLYCNLKWLNYKLLKCLLYLKLKKNAIN